MGRGQSERPSLAPLGTPPTHSGPIARPALALLAPQGIHAQDPATSPPRYTTPEGGAPWIYEGSDVPRDAEWIFGKLRVVAAHLHQLFLQALLFLCFRLSLR